MNTKQKGEEEEEEAKKVCRTGVQRNMRMYFCIFSELNPIRPFSNRLSTKSVVLHCLCVFVFFFPHRFTNI